ncbi:DUF4296 domain-containing protein [Bizionia myxarmorum]|uniref:DUF4296 domain-containing protein n=1 Tax=Bizionia myxarmorum TaxID=291186 RepID=A0A5D0RBU8_9FLAO|nr:DUF4296 domain-containing protein [Bizionia myxarmorum]TYB79017.1 DUF4296 domain-containing protein [Bizionia myxarmorum]
MKKNLIYAVFMLVLMGCSQFGGPKKPKNLISKNDMVSILVDLSLLSSAKGVNKMVLENNGISPEDYVYKTHNIDSLQFLNSNSYYSYNTEDYEVILKRVEDSLNALKTKYKAVINEKLNKDMKSKQLNDSNASSDSIRKKSRRIP